MGVKHCVIVGLVISDYGRGGLEGRWRGEGKRGDRYGKLGGREGEGGSGREGKGNGFEGGR